MAIFGTDAPKFQVSGTDVLLDHAVIENDDIDYKNILHESNIDRLRKFIPRPKHHDFTCVVHLHKYADPDTKFDEIVAQVGATCNLWRHRDFKPFQDTGGADADFIFLEYHRFYITTSDYADGLRLRFKSLEAIDHTKHADNFTFARALSASKSNAYYVDPTTGLWVAAADTTTARRLVAGKFKGTAIKVEGQRKNELNTDFSTWTFSASITATHNTAETKDPEGNNAATKLEVNAGSGASASFDTGLAVTTSDGIFSVFLKSPSGNQSVTISLETTTGLTLATKAVTAVPNGPDGNGFTRFDIVWDSNASKTGNWRVRINMGTNVGDIAYAFWPQLEAGVLSVSAPIPGNALTRNSEKFTLPVSSTKLTKNKGTISMWVKPGFDPTADNPVTMFFDSGDSAGAQADSHIRFYHGATIDRMILEVRKNNLDQTGISYTPAVASGLTRGNWHNIVATWDATIANGGRIFVDGVALALGFSINDPFNASETGDTIAVGSLINNTLHAYSEIDELFIDDRVWSADEVKQNFNLPGGLPRTLI